MLASVSIPVLVLVLVLVAPYSQLVGCQIARWQRWCHNCNLALACSVQASCLLTREGQRGASLIAVARKRNGLSICHREAARASASICARHHEQAESWHQASRLTGCFWCHLGAFRRLLALLLPAPSPFNRRLARRRRRLNLDWLGSQLASCIFQLAPAASRLLFIDPSSGGGVAAIQLEARKQARLYWHAAIAR